MFPGFYGCFGPLNITRPYLDDPALSQQHYPITTTCNPQPTGSCLFCSCWSPGGYTFVWSPQNTRLSFTAGLWGSTSQQDGANRASTGPLWAWASFLLKWLCVKSHFKTIVEKCSSSSDTTSSQGAEQWVHWQHVHIPLFISTEIWWHRSVTLHCKYVFTCYLQACTSLCCCTSNLNAGSSAPAAVFAKKVQTAQMNKTGQQNYFL